jgi:hypothetical protein
MTTVVGLLVLAMLAALRAFCLLEPDRRVFPEEDR